MSHQGREVFSRIARRYDLLNRVLSLGREQAWRRRGAQHLPPGRVLDLGSGTGSALPVFGERRVVAIDPVPEMLALSPIAARVVGVRERLPFPDEAFDGVFSAFVLRNLTSISETLAEVQRVIRPGGAAVVVDLARPRDAAARWAHRLGTGVVLPVAGWAIGARREYWYLHRSLDALPPPEELFRHPLLEVELLWRMGPLGFVYGAVLRKRRPAYPISTLERAV
ncbi:MAG: class I SAM-dependent methyltransferase [Acidimicrobiia bacterium]